MATQPRSLAWRIPRPEEPGGLQSMGSQGWTQLSTKHGPQHTYCLENVPTSTSTCVPRLKTADYESLKKTGRNNKQVT